MTARDTPAKKAAHWAVAQAILAGVLAAGCASSSGDLLPPSPQYLAAAPDHAADESKDAKDPFEKSNRSALESSRKFNQSVIYPIADAYQESVPEPVRDSISNFTSNLNEPVIFANEILQLRLKAAATTTGRFLVNSTIGLGGLFDVAAEQNMPKQTGDFGQTLYVWGVHESPYVVLPILGPTNVRDAIGSGIEMAATAVPTGGVMGAKLANSVSNIGNVGTALAPLSSLDKVGELRELEKGSVDFYSMLRSVVTQKRQAELDGAVAESTLTGPGAPGQWSVAANPDPMASAPGQGNDPGTLPSFVSPGMSRGTIIMTRGDVATGSTSKSDTLVIGPDASRSDGKIVIGPTSQTTGKIVIGPEDAAPPQGKIIIGPQSSVPKPEKIVIGPAPAVR